ncbi:hypothetical protein F441_13180 [Phytophthora nicotianae CJ01A1]|uniref:RxLR effector PexRD54 WY domain-containing protein n=1 Tax=Phytophthora nicotianae CJ01A1 TaxID=1317063 RepID=W2WLT3_PHYNI|nr:hypothetical protein F441_13180 [Phytophthora nicotianae CJ01A1]
MTSYYGDEALTRLLIKAMQTPSEANLATKLHEEQLQSWIYSRKLPGDVFKFLSLDKAGEKLFDHPQFMKWIKYVEDLNKANPDKKTTLMSVLAKQYDSEGLKWMAKGTPNDYFKQLKLDKEYNAANPKYQATLIGTLAANYGEMKLVKMLDEAMKVKDTASAAKKLQSELFQRWIRLNWTPEYIFVKVLHLDQEGDMLFTNPLVVTWGKYLSAFNRYTHGEETTIWMVLEATGYKIEELQRMVDRLPEQLFTMLRLGNKGDSLLTSPQLANWIQYLDNFYVTFPDMGKTMMKTVREYYHDISLVDMIVSAMKAPSTEKIAKRMELELFRNWHAVSHKTPDNIFQILELDEAGSMLLASPLLDMWIRYLTAFNKQTPSEKTSIIGTFLKYYDESELSQMIITAKGNTKTEELASNLEDALSLYKNS